MYRGGYSYEKSITAAELHDLIAADKQFIFIDVRRKEDFDQAPKTIAGALWQNPAEVDQWLQTIPAQQEMIVTVYAGVRLTKAG